MKKIYFLLILFFSSLSFGLTFKDGKQIDGSQSNTSSQTPADIQTSKRESEVKTFKPFDCRKLQTEHLKINNRNDCIIIQELSNKYEVKSHDYDTNTWNRSLLVRYIDNKDGEKIIAHTWNNVVNWGESSNKQPFSHLVVIDIPDLNEIFDSNLNQLSSNHYTLPLTARRLDTIDTDNDGDKEIIYLSNREDGRNRNSSWKDVNYIFDLNDSSLSKFGSSHFSHDLMYTDFNDDGFFEVIDYFYDPGGQIEVCDLKENKCTKSKNSTQFIEIGFNHILPSKDGAIMFGGCPNSGDTTFCWVKVDYKNNKLNFKKLDSYELKPQPKDKAKFLIWTGDVNENKGWWVEGSNEKMFKRARKSWMSASIDYDNDGFTDSVGIEKENLCTRNDISKPFKTPSECKEKAFLYVFKNINDEKFEKHQVIPTTINDTFRIEKADINKDGTMDLYGFRQGYYDPWSVCKKPQLKSVYLNKQNKYFERASDKLIEENFGLYGCERASNFFEKDGQYYRLFITTPDAEAEVAYIGIENYTGKFLTDETEDLSDEQLSAMGVVLAEEKKDTKTEQLDANNMNNEKKLKPKEVLSIISILNDVNPLNKIEAESFKTMLEPVSFDSLGINLTGAKLISFEKDYLIYEGLFNYKDSEFSITLCAQYWDEHKFIGNSVGFNFTKGFGNVEKLKNYGKNWCGNTKGFLGHWEPGSEMIKAETELFPFLKEIESNWPEIFKNFSMLNDNQNKIINNWN